MKKKEKTPKENQPLELEKGYLILDLAIYYAILGTYQLGLIKDKKRAVQRRAQTLMVENGEVFVEKKDKKNLQDRAASYIKVMSLWLHFWPLWTNKDMEESSGTVLLDRGD